MNVNLIPSKIKIFAGILIVSIFVLTLTLLLNPQTSTPQPTPNSSPRQPSSIIPITQPIPAEEPGYTGPQPGSVYQTPLPEYNEAVRINELLGLLLKKLPYEGSVFNLRYDGISNSFIATFYSGKEQTGKQELENFLKENQIQSTDWLYNYKIETR